MDMNDLLNAPFTFTKRKNYTPCDTRPLWKSCLIVLIIGLVGNDHSASLKKIHVTNWLVKKKEHLDVFMRWGGKDDHKRPDVRLEPAIDRVTNLLVSNKLVYKNGGKIILTQTGLALFQELNVDDMFAEEKHAMIKAKKFLSEASVNRVFEGV